MTRPFTIRDGTETDIPAVLELMRTSLGEKRLALSEAYFRWKHLQNPFGQSPMLLAVAEEQIVGVRIFLRWRWRTPHGQLNAVRAVDTATHPQWQGRGVFTSLTQALVEHCTRDGVALIYNTPNDQSRPGYLKMGWEVAGRPTVWVRPALGLLGRARASTTADQTDPQDLQALLGAADLETLLTADGQRLQTPLSREYLRWRYHDVPGIRYGAERSQAHPRAAAIYRVQERFGRRELTVCELLASRLDGATIRDARHAFHALERRHRPTYLLAVAPLRSRAAALLLASGFMCLPALGPRVTVRPLQPEAQPFRRLRRWRPSVGDLELF